MFFSNPSVKVVVLVARGSVFALTPSPLLISLIDVLRVA
jgi:hypothetical protein